MPKQTIDRAQLVEKAYGIAEAEGLSTLSARKLAEACGVSVGSLYNYFPTKADLTTAVIERFFGKAFFTDFCHEVPGEGFVDYLRRLFAVMQKTLARFRSDWLTEIRSLPPDVRAAGKKLEAERFEHVVRGLVAVFDHDTRIDRTGLPPELAPDRLCPLALSNLLEALRKQEDCETFFVLLDTALYHDR